MQRAFYIVWYSIVKKISSNSSLNDIIYIKTLNEKYIYRKVGF